MSGKTQAFYAGLIAIIAPHKGGDMSILSAII
jgi:hypothetical protein